MLRSRATPAVVLLLLASAALDAAKITEFTVPTNGSRPWPIVSGPDGRIWFCENSGNNVGAMTTAGVFTEYAIPSPAAECDGLVTMGAASHPILLFSEYGTGLIGFVSPDGTTKGELPTVYSSPIGLVDGHDGRLWIAQSTAASVYAKLINGANPNVNNPTASASSGPHGLAYGADGQIWITESSISRIGACSVNSVSCVEALTPTPGAGPYDIAAGPDGNLWYTEYLGNAIGRVTPSGLVTEFAIPTSSSSPSGIAAGPDGNVWFVEYDGNKVGRITPSGTITEYTIPTAASHPLGITTGPDGNIWFTEYDGNKIGRLQVFIAADVDGSGTVDVADVFYLINFLFAGGPPPK
jgi:streptogramin lyase